MEPLQPARIVTPADVARKGIITPGSDQKPPDVKEVMEALQRDVHDYHQAIKSSPHDPLKVMVAGMVNKKLLDDTAQECEKAAEGTEYKAPSAEKLQEIQNWAFKYKKKHPLATAEQVQRATCLAFNLVIVPEDDPA